MNDVRRDITIGIIGKAWFSEAIQRRFNAGLKKGYNSVWRSIKMIVDEIQFIRVRDLRGSLISYKQLEESWKLL